MADAIATFVEQRVSANRACGTIPKVGVKGVRLAAMLLLFCDFRQLLQV